MRPRILILTLALGCGNDAAPSSSVAAPDAGPSCPEGFAIDDTLSACVETVPESCPDGTMAMIGSAECQPVGWTTTCPAGFDRQGFACIDEFAPAPEAECATPTGRLVVDGAAAPDATHFKTLDAAMHAAQEGDVIAVESGTYPEVIDFSRAPNGITVVGRCAAKVRFVAAAGEIHAGVYAVGKATLRGVTVTGFPGGIYEEGGDLTVEDVAVDGNHAVGVFLKLGSKLVARHSTIAHTTHLADDEVGGGIVVYDQSELTLEDSSVTDNYLRNATVDRKSTLTATRSVFARNTKLAGSTGHAQIVVTGGATVTLSQSAVTDGLFYGIEVGAAGSQATITESVVRDTSGTLANGGGIDVIVHDGAAAHVTSSTIAGGQVLGVYVDTKGTLDIQKSTLLGVPRGAPVDFGRCAQAADQGTLTIAESALIECPQSGIGVQEGGTATLDRVLVKDAWPIKQDRIDYGGFGLVVETSSKATVKRSTFEHDTGYGISSNQKAVVSGEAVLIRATQASGTVSSGIQVARGGKLDLARSALVGNVGETIQVVTSGQLSLAESTIHGTTTADGNFGHGLVVFEGGSAVLTSVAIFDQAAVGFVSDGGSALIRGGLFARNPVAVHAQNGAELTESDDDGDLGASEVRVSKETRFVDNATKVGSGHVVVAPE